MRSDVEKTLHEYGITRWLVIERGEELEVFVGRTTASKRYCISTAMISCVPVGTIWSVSKLPWWKCLFRKKRWIVK